MVGRLFCNQFVTDKWYNIRVLVGSLGVSGFWLEEGGERGLVAESAEGVSFLCLISQMGEVQWWCADLF